MNLISTSFLLLTFAAAEDKPAQHAAKLPIGKETTYVDGPLDKDGYIDYEAALNDRLSKGITPEKNANILLWKAFGPTPEGAKVSAEIFKRLGIEEPPAHGDYFIGPQEFTRDYLKLDKDASEAFNDQLSRAVKRPWTAKDYPHIAAWLKANEKPLVVVVKAIKRPDYYNPIICQRNEKNRGPLIGALLPSMQKCRVVADALDARAMLRIGEGTFEEAWQDLLACHRLGRVVTRGPCLIEALIGMAIDAIASRADLVYLESANLTVEQIQVHHKDLQGLPPIAPIADKIELAERLMYLDSLQATLRGDVRALQVLSGEPAKKPEAEDLKPLEKTEWAAALRTGNQWFDRTVAVLRPKARADREKGLDKIEEELKAVHKEDVLPANLAKLAQRKNSPDEMIGKTIGNVLFGMIMPACRPPQRAYDRTEQIHRNLHVAFALAAYHSDNGRYPAKLDDLAPKYLAAVPGDLFSGKSLIYLSSERGYLFYSVGVKGKDDGGRAFDDDPPGGNLPVRMPLPVLKAKK